MWINTETQQTFTTHSEIRSSLEHVSLPSVITDEMLADISILPLLGSVPTFDALTQVAVETEPLLVDGSWTRQWDISDLPQEAADANRAAAKASARNAVKAERDRRIQLGGYQAGGKWFHSDTFSRTQQIGLAMLGANIPAGVMWKTMDGSFIEMTPTLAAQIFAAAMISDNATFAHANDLISQIDASQDPRSIDIKAGWPATFQV